MAGTNAHCPRCGKDFECGASVGRCACFEIRLSPEQRAEIARQWADCLCLSCLREIAATPCPSSTASRPASSS